jgi:hypothetical protein
VGGLLNWRRNLLRTTTRPLPTRMTAREGARIGSSRQCEAGLCERRSPPPPGSDTCGSGAGASAFQGFLERDAISWTS